MGPLNLGNSKETESSGKNGCRQKFLDKSLMLMISSVIPIIHLSLHVQIAASNNSFIVPF